MPVLVSLLAALIEVVEIVLNLYIWLLIIGAVLTWLVAFDVINTHNRFVRMVGDFCYKMTEPLLKPIRKRLPSLGGIDISPIVLILIIMFLQSFLRHLLVAAA